MKIVMILLMLSMTSIASTLVQETTASSMVPRGRIVERFGRDFNLKTMAGTKIRLEFMRDGNLEEASGSNLNKGDVFEPGLGLLSLSTAAQYLIKNGARFLGKWHLDNDPKLGWVYEFESEGDPSPKEILVNAKTGAIITRNTNENRK